VEWKFAILGRVLLRRADNESLRHSHASQRGVARQYKGAPSVQRSTRRIHHWQLGGTESARFVEMHHRPPRACRPSCLRSQLTGRVLAPISLGPGVGPGPPPTPYNSRVCFSTLTLCSSSAFLSISVCRPGILPGLSYARSRLYDARLSCRFGER
jgi:hypothetical protein